MMPISKSEGSAKPRANGLDKFITAVESEFHRQNPTATLDRVRDDLASKCFDRWLVLDKREKMFFSRKDSAIKKRGSTTTTTTTTTKKQKRSRDPNHPKRALTAYLYFCKEERRLLSQSGSSLALGDITREIAKKWKQIPAKQRLHFEQLAAADRQRYQSEMEAFQNCRHSSVEADDDLEDLVKTLGRSAKNDHNEHELLTVPFTRHRSV